MIATRHTDAGLPLHHAIVGAGKVGTALARHFARSGIPVGLANTRGPESLAAIAPELGDHVVPLALEEALRANLVVLAVPFRAHAELGRALDGWGGKIVVDAMNAFGVPAGDLAGRPSSAVVASAFPGAKVVKAFNQLPAKVLAEDPVANGGRRVVFLSSDHPDAEEVVGRLVADLGFAPIRLGRLDQGGKLLGIDGPLILQNLVKLA